MGLVICKVLVKQIEKVDEPDLIHSAIIRLREGGSIIGTQSFHTMGKYSSFSMVIYSHMHPRITQVHDGTDRMPFSVLKKIILPYIKE